MTLNFNKRILNLSILLVSLISESDMFDKRIEFVKMTLKFH